MPEGEPVAREAMPLCPQEHSTVSEGGTDHVSLSL